MRLLLVDDERPLLRALECVLEDQYELFTASSVDAAVRAVEAFSPFAILCDLGLPGRDGTCLHDVVSTRWPALARRMVFMTGGIHRTVRAKALSSGCPILEKPFSVSDVVEIVQRVSRSAEGDAAAESLAGSGHRGSLG